MLSYKRHLFSDGSGIESVSNSEGKIRILNTGGTVMRRMRYASTQPVFVFVVFATLMSQQV